MKRRVKINKLPKGYMQNGGSVSKSLGPVPREFANLEAEKGEVIATEDNGDLALFSIGGKRHSEGGTPMNRPPGDFIWSDTKKMKIKDEDILNEFGASKAATPAKLAKKFLDTNDYRAILDNPQSDDLSKKTAAMMIDKNKEKLARLAFVQEEMKGFPQGIPSIAQDYAASIGVPMAEYGGAMMPKAQFGEETGLEQDIINRYKAKQNLESSWAPGSYAAASRMKFKPEELAVINRYLNPDQTPSNESSFKKSPEEQDAFMKSRGLVFDPSKGGYVKASSTEQSSQTESSIFAPNYSTPENPIIYQTPAETAPAQSAPSTQTAPAVTTSSNTASSASADPASRRVGNIELYEGSRQNTPTNKNNRFNYSEQEFFNDWESVIPGIKNMTNEQAQAAAYEYMLENNPGQLGVMWNEFGLTKKGLANEALVAKYPDGKIPANLTAEDLKNLEQAYVDGFFGARQMRPPGESVTKIPRKETPQLRETEEEMSIPEVRTYKDAETKPFEQDLRNERVLARNRMSERKRYPWRGRLAGRAADPLYQSDVNQQQNLQAQNAIAANAATSFADPNALMANLSRLSGLTGDKSNEIAAQIQRENTNIGNQFERFNTQLAAQNDVRNLTNAQQLFDLTTKTDEVFDEKMRNYNVASTRQKNITDTNLSRARVMNKLNPLFNINTGEGPQFGDIQFQPGMSAAMFEPGQASAVKQQEAFLDAQLQQILEDRTLTPEDRSKLTEKIYEQRLGLSKSAAGNMTPEQAAAMYQYNQMMGTVGIPQSKYAGYQTPSRKRGGEAKKRRY